MNSSKIEVYFYGKADVNGDVKFDVCLVNGELRIKFRFTDDWYIGNLKIDVTVPHKIFKEILVKSTCGNITLRKNVLFEQLRVETQSGNLETRATFANVSAITKVRNINIR